MLYENASHDSDMDSSFTGAGKEGVKIESHRSKTVEEDSNGYLKNCIDCTFYAFNLLLDSTFCMYIPLDKSPFETTRGLLLDGPRNFEPWLDDEDRTCAAKPLSKFPRHSRGVQHQVSPAPDPIHGRSLAESAFET
ncbi:hypothetical protein AVEN_252499-1 [Araneus ventricosus]|uniref:Uncharacterized protein n=1 Tax=Araneus ventricosus TaxID=182803 RepID=A0A4Y2ARK7_ARAVE|nr:hypothetical protein AVEN_252499-1 [Araneus ventricosus]